MQALQSNIGYMSNLHYHERCECHECTQSRRGNGFGSWVTGLQQQQMSPLTASEIQKLREMIAEREKENG